MVFCLPKPAQAQTNDVEAGLFNIAIGGVLGGVGAMINKRPGEGSGKVLVKGLWQGALGGYVVFESKRLVREFAETGNLAFVWPSKLVNSAGTSIIENAAANRDLWERWHLNIGFNRLEINTTENFRLSYRIMPAALFTTVYSFSNARLNPNLSLRMGTFVFVTSEIGSDPNTLGQSRLNAIVIKEGIKGRIALPHELLHNYQYERLSGFNAFWNKPMEKLSEDFPLVATYNKIFYSDFNAVLHRSLYYLANPDGENYLQNNIFEREAEYYADVPPRRKIVGF